MDTNLDIIILFCARILKDIHRCNFVRTIVKMRARFIRVCKRESFDENGKILIPPKIVESKVTEKKYILDFLFLCIL